MVFKSEPFLKTDHLVQTDQNPRRPAVLWHHCLTRPCCEGFKEEPRPFPNRDGGEELDSSDSQKNHGNKPGEKDNIDEKSFHTILIGLVVPKVKFFLVL